MSLERISTKKRDDDEYPLWYRALAALGRFGFFVIRQSPKVAGVAGVAYVGVKYHDQILDTAKDIPSQFAKDVASGAEYVGTPVFNGFDRATDGVADSVQNTFNYLVEHWRLSIPSLLVAATVLFFIQRHFYYKRLSARYPINWQPSDHHT